MPQVTHMQTKEEVRRYLASIEDRDSVAYAATEFLSRALANEALARAAKGLTHVISSYDRVLMPAKILMAGYTTANPSEKRLKMGWDLTLKLGRFAILTTTAGPLGALVGGAALGFSVLLMFDEVEKQHQRDLHEALIESMAQNLGRIRDEAQARLAAARRRDAAPATDADRADRRNVLAVVARTRFTPDEKARTLSFLEHTLYDVRDSARPLSDEQRRLRRRFKELGDNDLALIYAMGAPLIDLDLPSVRGQEVSDVRRRMMDFEEEVLVLMHLTFDEREAQIASEDPAHAVPVFLTASENGGR
jgi:hypothetical protein